MSMKLVLGVIDVPYRDPKGKTTGDVAEILEAKYHPMEIFWELHQNENTRDLTNSLQGSLESMLMGGPLPSDPFISGLGKIETRFKKFLNDGEMERLGYPGVPTQAALKGINHRLSRPHAKTNRRRPSFIDYGLYRDNFKAWIEK